MKITQLLALGALAALYLILAQVGVTSIYLFGLPAGTGGIINLLWSATIPVIAVLVVRRFWAATLMLTVYYALAIPLPIGGTPGFVPKILLGAVGGLPMDIAYHFLRRHEKVASIVMAIVSNLALTLGVIGLGTAFGLPGVDIILSMFLNPKIFLAVLVVAGALGLSAWAVYRKLKSTAVVRRIQQ